METDRPVGLVACGPGDLILMAEGRQIEFLEPSTKGIEIKQGPIPAAIAGEMVVHGSLPGPAAVTKNTL